MSLLQPRYAAHRLRLGAFFARGVLVEALPQGAWRLAPFTEEIERTIFLSGEMTLEEAPLDHTPVASLQEVTIPELQRLADSLRGAKLYYQGRPLLSLSHE